MPNGNIVNQIDHVVIDKRHQKCLMDVRSCRGANVDSDHFLVVAKIRQKISNNKNRRTTKVKEKYNIETLKNDEIVLNYKNKMKQEIEKMGIKIDRNVNGIQIDDEWKTIKEIITTTAEETIGKIHGSKRNSWFDDECRIITEEKNKAYLKMIQKGGIRSYTELYRNKRREEKHIHRKKKRKFENDRLLEIETHKEHKEIQKFYKFVNNERKSFKPRTNLCRDLEDNILTSKDDILNRWNNHFSTLLNGNNINDDDDVVQYMEKCIVMRNNNHRMEDNHNGPPTREEINECIKQLKNNKAPGGDGIQAELLKHITDELQHNLCKLIKKIWEEEIIPVEWKMGIVCPLYKKGDQLVCSNYRGITLLNTAYKIFSKILYNRLQPYVKEIIGKYQTGFCRGKSTIDQIYTLRQILEKTIEGRIETHHLFIDFSTAYDSVNRASLYNAMEEFEIPHKLIKLVKATMDNSQCRVKIQADLSDPFITRNGLRQGDSLACLLFNIALEKIIRDAGIQTRGTIFYKSVQILAFADDIDIIARSERDLIKSFSLLKNAAGNMGLKINEDKTKYMMVNSQSNRKQAKQIVIDNYKIEIVQRFSYLGSIINSNNNILEEINKRIQNANRCYYGLQSQFKSKILSRETKCRLYRTLIKPILMYASETWPLGGRDIIRLAAFERKILRRIYGPVKDGEHWRIRYNHELYQLYKSPNIIQTIKIARLRWVGHVRRMNESEIPRKVMEYKILGGRRVGRPTLRWMDCVADDIKTLEIKNWWTVAQDRNRWRKLLKEAEARPGLWCY